MIDTHPQRPGYLDRSASGLTVLDFVRYNKDLKGTKIGCREGDCGACTILVGELRRRQRRYRIDDVVPDAARQRRRQTHRHVEGINPDRGLTPVQQAMVDESGTQCGFCTVGFVMSLTGFCLDTQAGSLRSDAISAIDGNICRCTGYKSIERCGSALVRTACVSGRPVAGHIWSFRSGILQRYRFAIEGHFEHREV